MDSELKELYLYRNYHVRFLLLYSCYKKDGAEEITL